MRISEIRREHKTYSLSQRVGAVDHDSADNVRVTGAQSSVGIHRDVQEPVRVGIGTAASANVANRKLGNIENLADIANEGFRSQTTNTSTIVDVVQAPVC